MLRESVKILELFYGLSGLQLQKKKTQVDVFGRIPPGNLNFCSEIDLKWDQDFTLLGIIFNGELNNIVKNCRDWQNYKLLEVQIFITHW